MISVLCIKCIRYYPVIYRERSLSGYIGITVDGIYRRSEFAGSNPAEAVGFLR